MQDVMDYQLNNPESDLNRYLGGIIQQSVFKNDPSTPKNKIEQLAAIIRQLIVPVYALGSSADIPAHYTIISSPETQHLYDVCYKTMEPYGGRVSYALVGYWSIVWTGPMREGNLLLDHLLAKLLAVNDRLGQALITDMLANGADELTRRTAEKMWGSSSLRSMDLRYRMELLNVLLVLATQEAPWWTRTDEKIATWAEDRLREIPDTGSDDPFDRIYHQHIEDILWILRR
jgi:hypothetical protein